MAEKDLPQKVVVHYQDGKILKGYMKNFKPTDAEATFTREEKKPSESLHIQLKELKAIYYVKSHDGNKEYREKKQFGLTSSKGKKIMVKFKDRELVCGYVIGEVPQLLGKNLSSSDTSLIGFFLFPADPKSNNTKMFVVTSSVEEIQEF